MGEKGQQGEFCKNTTAVSIYVDAAKGFTDAGVLPDYPLFNSFSAME